MHTTTCQLAAIQPFDFARSLAFLTAFSPMAGEQHIDRTTIWKAVKLDGVVIGAKLSACDGGIAVTLSSVRPLSTATRTRALDWARSFLSLDDDLNEFYARAAEDEVVAPFVRRLHGLHQVRLTTPFEGAVWAVLGQRCARSVARGMKDRLVAAHGGSITVDDRELPAFPEASDLRCVDEAALTVLLGHAQKARRVRAVIDAFLAVDEGFLRRGPVDKVRGWLLAIDGIGPWSAAFVLLRAMGRVESIAGAETQLADSISAAYRRPLSTSQLGELASEWQGLQGYWSYYLKAGASLR